MTKAPVAEYCEKPVTNIVRRAHWQGDWYGVCDFHTAWAKTKLPYRDVVFLSPKASEPISKCVYGLTS